ncbi:MAG: AAA family ATPase [Bacteroidota bacterium]
MKPIGECQKAIEYLESHSAERQHKKTGPCITISRQSGAGSGIVNQRLKELLEARQDDSFGQWAIFDKNLIEKVLEDHNLPDRIAKFMTRENYSAISTMINELLGLHPSMRSLFHKTTETILRLAHIGNVIIVGRGGAMVTSMLPNAFHVRLVAPLENRIQRIQDYYQLNRKQAAEFIKNEDEGRKELFTKNFHRDIEDPLLYHITLNTGTLSHDETAQIIAGAVCMKFPHMFPKHGENVVVNE